MASGVSSGNKFITLKTDVDKKYAKDIPKFTKYVNTKQLMADSAEIARESINKVIPRRSGDLQEKGYKILISNSKIKPWFKLSYGNTTKLPYVMYQYYGKVWKTNRPIIEKTDGDGSEKAYATRKHVGWYSKGPKTPTNRDFSRRRRTFTLFKRVLKRAINAKDVKVKRFNWREQTRDHWVKEPYARVVIQGYKNSKSQPKWLEYAFERRYDKEIGYQNKINDLIEKTYMDALIAAYTKNGKKRK